MRSREFPDLGRQHERPRRIQVDAPALRPDRPYHRLAVMHPPLHARSLRSRLAVICAAFVAHAAIHASFAGMGRPSFFNDARTRAYVNVVDSVTVRISKSDR